VVDSANAIAISSRASRRSFNSVSFFFGYGKRDCFAGRYDLRASNRRIISSAFVGAPGGWQKSPFSLVHLFRRSRRGLDHSRRTRSFAEISKKDFAGPRSDRLTRHAAFWQQRGRENHRLWPRRRDDEEIIDCRRAVAQGLTNFIRQLPNATKSCGANGRTLSVGPTAGGNRHRGLVF